MTKSIQQILDEQRQQSKIGSMDNKAIAAVTNGYMSGQDPVVRAKQFKAAKKRAADPEYQRKQKEGMARLKTDPEYQRMMRESKQHLKDNPEHSETVRKSIQLKYDTDQEYHNRIKESAKVRAERLRNDPDWMKKKSETSQRLAKDPEWNRKREEGHARARATEEYQENYKAGMAKNRASRTAKCREVLAKPIVTPFGAFFTQGDATNHLFKNNLTTRTTLGSVRKLIQNSLKKENSGYYYISKEEYIMLTGKE